MQLPPSTLIKTAYLIRESLKQPPPESDLGRCVLAIIHLDEGKPWPPPYFADFDKSTKAYLIELLIYVRTRDDSHDH